MEYKILALQEGLKYHDEEVWVTLRDLAVVVQRKHYPKPTNPDDLVSEALLAACDSILRDKEKGSYRNLRSYIYTVMRNTMSNMMYHSSKELSIEETKNISVQVPEEVETRIPQGRIELVLEGMPSLYKAYQVPLHKALNNLITGNLTEPIGRKDDDNLDRLLTLVLWSIKEGVERDGS